jgi:outer membrane protein TolC
MPTIAAFGQISYIGQEPSNLGGLMGGGAGAPANSDKKLWWQYPISLGAQISIPIFAGFSKTNQLREVRNQRAQLDIQREYTERGLKLQVQASVNNLLTARETMLSNELTVEQSKFWWQYPITIGAQINIPIFAGLKKTNQLREVRNQREQLRIQRSYAEEGVRLQVQQSVNTLLTARAMMLANGETVLQAEKAYEISLTRYEAGAGTILELNSAQLSLTQAQLSYSQSIYDYLAAYNDYEKALGKDVIE